MVEQQTVNLLVHGSIPCPGAIILGVRQAVSQGSLKPSYIGSNPILPTIFLTPVSASHYNRSMGIEKEISILEGGVTLSPKTRKFIRLYDGDIASSMRNAGFIGTEKQLTMNGRLLLAQPAVQAAIKELAQIQASEVSLVAKKDEILGFLSSTMRNEDPNHIKTVKDGIVQEVDNIAITSRLKAAELLGKNAGMFVDRIEHSGSIGIMDIVKRAQDDEDDDLDAIEAEYVRVSSNQKSLETSASQSDPFADIGDLI